ncbi:MAG TPA: hypothetical protein DCG73_05790 [Morganella sp. (in: Bacteria)]|nr:hypothetical protein [Morganella sp. (in: enterobacteria)]
MWHLFLILINQYFKPVHCSGNITFSDPGFFRAFRILTSAFPPECESDINKKQLSDYHRYFYQRKYGTIAALNTCNRCKPARPYGGQI